MTGKERGPEWQGDDSFGAGWGNQTTHDPHPAEGRRRRGFRRRRDARAISPKAAMARRPGGGGFAIRDAAWHEDVEKIRAHMEVLRLGRRPCRHGRLPARRAYRADEERRHGGRRASRHPAAAGSRKVDDKVHLDLDAAEAMRALAGRGAQPRLVRARGQRQRRPAHPRSRLLRHLFRRREEIGPAASPAAFDSLRHSADGTGKTQGEA